MHATIVHTTIDPAQIDEAIAGIAAVKQRLSGMPGFLHAYRMEPSTAKVCRWDSGRTKKPLPLRRHLSGSPQLRA